MATVKLLCRLCAVADPEKQMLDILGIVENEFNIFENVSRHLGIWVTQDQVLPTMACSSCIEKLQSFALFHNQCHKAQEFLEKMVCNPEAQDDIPLASLFNNLHSTVDCDDDISVKKEATDSEHVKEETAIDIEEDDVTDFIYEGADLISNYWSPPSPIEKKCRINKRNRRKRYKPRSKNKLKKCTATSSTDGDTSSKKNTQCLDKYFTFTCHICNNKCINWSRLKVHMLQKHQQPAKSKCLLCGLVLKSRSTIYRHVSNHNDPSIFSCDQCTRITKSEEALERHKMRHKPKSEAAFQCVHCPKVFTARENLKSHERVHIPKEQRYIYPCEICGTKFTTKSAVAGHKRAVHDKLKRFMCDLCGYSCSTSGELAQHRAIHYDEKLFMCPMCPKSFKTSSNLKAHLDTHDTTSYQCPHCDKVLNSRRTLKKHLLVHDDVCRHICSFCNKAFKRRQTLKVHLTSHTGDTPIQCPWCTQKFAYSSAFRSHKQKLHPQEYALQQKMYQEKLPKTSSKSEDGLIHKQDTFVSSFNDDMAIDVKMFPGELETKSGENLILKHMQKHYENGLAALRKRNDITLIPKEDDFEHKLFEK